MKPRALIVALKLHTNADIVKLRNKRIWDAAIAYALKNSPHVAEVEQVQVNVAKPMKPRLVKG